MADNIIGVTLAGLGDSSHLIATNRLKSKHNRPDTIYLNANGDYRKVNDIYYYKVDDPRYILRRATAFYHNSTVKHAKFATGGLDVEDISYDDGADNGTNSNFRLDLWRLEYNPNTMSVGFNGEPVEVDQLKQDGGIFSYGVDGRGNAIAGGYNYEAVYEEIYDDQYDGSGGYYDVYFNDYGDYGIDYYDPYSGYAPTYEQTGYNQTGSGNTLTNLAGNYPSIVLLRQAITSQDRDGILLAGYGNFPPTSFSDIPSVKDVSWAVYDPSVSSTGNRFPNLSTANSDKITFTDLLSTDTTLQFDVNNPIYDSIVRYEVSDAAKGDTQSWLANYYTEIPLKFFENEAASRATAAEYGSLANAVIQHKQDNSFIKTFVPPPKFSAEAVPLNASCILFDKVGANDLVFRSNFSNNSTTVDQSLRVPKWAIYDAAENGYTPTGYPYIETHIPFTDSLVNGQPSQDPINLNTNNTARFTQDSFLRMNGRILLHGNEPATLTDENGQPLLQDINNTVVGNGTKLLDDFRVEIIVDPGTLYESDFKQPKTANRNYPLNFTGLYALDSGNDMDPSAPFWFRAVGANLQGLVSAYGIGASSNTGRSFGVLNPAANSGSGRTIVPDDTGTHIVTFGNEISHGEAAWTNSTSQNVNRNDGTQRLGFNGFWGRCNDFSGKPSWRWRETGFTPLQQFDDQTGNAKDNYTNIDAEDWEGGSGDPVRDYRIEYDTTDEIWYLRDYGANKTNGLTPYEDTADTRSTSNYTNVYKCKRFQVGPIGNEYAERPLFGATEGSKTGTLTTTGNGGPALTASDDVVTDFVKNYISNALDENTISKGKPKTFSWNSRDMGDSAITPGTYNITSSQYTTNGSGGGASFQIIVDSDEFRVNQITVTGTSSADADAFFVGENIRIKHEIASANEPVGGFDFYVHSIEPEDNSRHADGWEGVLLEGDISNVLDNSPDSPNPGSGQANNYIDDSTNRKGTSRNSVYAYGIPPTISATGLKDRNNIMNIESAYEPNPSLSQSSSNPFAVSDGITNGSMQLAIFQRFNRAGLRGNTTADNMNLNWDGLNNISDNFGYPMLSWFLGYLTTGDETRGNTLHIPLINTGQDSPSRTGFSVDPFLREGRAASYGAYAPEGTPQDGGVWQYDLKITVGWEGREKITNGVHGIDYYQILNCDLLEKVSGTVADSVTREALLFSEGDAFKIPDREIFTNRLLFGGGVNPAPTNNLGGTNSGTYKGIKIFKGKNLQLIHDYGGGVTETRLLRRMYLSNTVIGETGYLNDGVLTGNSITVILVCNEGTPVGTVIPWRLESIGGSVTFEDFIGLTAMRGNFVVGADHTDRLILELNPDNKIEGTEKCRIYLEDEFEESFRDFTIQDTSLPAEYTLRSIPDQTAGVTNFETNSIELNGFPTDISKQFADDRIIHAGMVKSDFIEKNININRRYIKRSNTLFVSEDSNYEIVMPKVETTAYIDKLVLKGFGAPAIDHSSVLDKQDYIGDNFQHFLGYKRSAELIPEGFPGANFYIYPRPDSYVGLCPSGFHTPLDTNDLGEEYPLIPDYREVRFTKPRQLVFDLENFNMGIYRLMRSSIAGQIDFNRMTSDGKVDYGVDEALPGGEVVNDTANTLFGSGVTNNPVLAANAWAVPEDKISKFNVDTQAGRTFYRISDSVYRGFPTKTELYRYGINYSKNAFHPATNDFPPEGEDFPSSIRDDYYGKNIKFENVDESHIVQYMMDFTWQIELEFDRSKGDTGRRWVINVYRRGTEDASLPLIQQLNLGRGRLNTGYSNTALTILNPETPVDIADWYAGTTKYRMYQDKNNNSTSIITKPHLTEFEFVYEAYETNNSNTHPFYRPQDREAGIKDEDTLYQVGTIEPILKVIEYDKERWHIRGHRYPFKTYYIDNNYSPNQGFTATQTELNQPPELVNWQPFDYNTNPEYFTEIDLREITNADVEEGIKYTEIGDASVERMYYRRDFDDGALIRSLRSTNLDTFRVYADALYANSQFAIANERNPTRAITQNAFDNKKLISTTTGLLGLSSSAGNAKALQVPKIDELILIHESPAGVKTDGTESELNIINEFDVILETKHLPNGTIVPFTMSSYKNIDTAASSSLVSSLRSSITNEDFSASATLIPGKSELILVGFGNTEPYDASPSFGLDNSPIVNPNGLYRYISSSPQIFVKKDEYRNIYVNGVSIKHPRQGFNRITEIETTDDVIFQSWSIEQELGIRADGADGYIEGSDFNASPRLEVIGTRYKAKLPAITIKEDPSRIVKKISTYGGSGYQDKPPSVTVYLGSNEPNSNFIDGSTIAQYPNFLAGKPIDYSPILESGQNVKFANIDGSSTTILPSTTVTSSSYNVIKFEGTTSINQTAEKYTSKFMVRKWITQSINTQYAYREKRKDCNSWGFNCKARYKNRYLPGKSTIRLYPGIGTRFKERDVQVGQRVKFYYSGVDKNSSAGKLAVAAGNIEATDTNTTVGSSIDYKGNKYGGRQRLSLEGSFFKNTANHYGHSFDQPSSSEFENTDMITYNENASTNDSADAGAPYAQAQLDEDLYRVFPIGEDATSDKIVGNLSSYSDDTFIIKKEGWDKEFTGNLGREGKGFLVTAVGGTDSRYGYGDNNNGYAGGSDIGWVEIEIDYQWRNLDGRKLEPHIGMQMIVERDSFGEEDQALFSTSQAFNLGDGLHNSPTLNANGFTDGDFRSKRITTPYIFDESTWVDLTPPTGFTLDQCQNGISNFNPDTLILLGSSESHSDTWSTGSARTITPDKVIDNIFTNSDTHKYYRTKNIPAWYSGQNTTGDISNATWEVYADGNDNDEAGRRTDSSPSGIAILRNFVATKDRKLKGQFVINIDNSPNMSNSDYQRLNGSDSITFTLNNDRAIIEDEEIFQLELDNAPDVPPIRFKFVNNPNAVDMPDSPTRSITLPMVFTNEPINVIQPYTSEAAAGIIRTANFGKLIRNDSERFPPDHLNPYIDDGVIYKNYYDPGVDVSIQENLENYDVQLNITGSYGIGTFPNITYYYRNLIHPDTRLRDFKSGSFGQIDSYLYSTLDNFSPAADSITNYITALSNLNPNSPNIGLGEDDIYKTDSTRALNSPARFKVASISSSPFIDLNSPIVTDSSGNNYKVTETIQGFIGEGWPPPATVDLKSIHRIVPEEIPVRNLYYWVVWQVEKLDTAVNPPTITTELECVEYIQPVGNQVWKDLSKSLSSYVNYSSPGE